MQDRLGLPHFAAVLALVSAFPLACKSRTPTPATPPAPAAPLPGIEPAPPVELNDADAYFAVIEPHMQRLSIYDPPDKFLAAYAATPEKARNLLAAHWCASEISNGGFLQLFSSAAGVLVPEAVVGLRAIGLPENAAIVEEAMQPLGKPYPREHNQRYRIVQRLKRKAQSKRATNTTPSDAPPFAALDERFFTALKAHPGGFDALAAHYARTPEK
jgi:hypothetical protein